MVRFADSIVAVVLFSAEFVCVADFPHDISKIDAASITKFDIKMFRHESCKPIYFGVKRSNVTVTRHKITVPVSLFSKVLRGDCRTVNGSPPSIKMSPTPWFIRSPMKRPGVCFSPL